MSAIFSAYPTPCLYVKKKSSRERGTPPQSNQLYWELIIEKFWNLFPWQELRIALESRFDQVETGDPLSADMKKKGLYHPSQNYVNGSASFVRERQGSWLSRGRSGRWVTLVRRTSFLHINEALEGSSLLFPFNPVMSSTLQEEIRLRYQLVAITTWASKQFSIFMRFKTWGWHSPLIR